MVSSRASPLSSTRLNLEIETNGQSIALLERAERNRRSRRPHRLDRADALAEEGAQRVRIGDTHLHQVAVFAGDVMHLLRFRNLREEHSGLRVADTVLAAHENERR